MCGPPLLEDTYKNQTLLLNLPFQAEEASRLLLNLVRIEELTSDMSWKVGIAHNVKESKWVTSAQHKAKTISMIRAGFAPTGKRRRRKSR